MADENKTYTFVLNDEDKVNSYGFRVLNKGINLKRFKKNPVILDAHISWSNMRVIGRWENIRIEGSQLKADASFDMEDKEAAKIAGKVERGYIKGCSMGLDPDRGSFEIEETGNHVLKKCELMEASIVPVPSNAHAVKLYAEPGKLMDDKEIKLSMSPDADQSNANNNPNNKPMKEIKLSIATLLVLGIDNTEDSFAFGSAVEKLAAEHTALKQEVETLKKEKEKEIKLNAEKMVQLAVEEGKIKANEVDTWVDLAIAKPDLFKTTLSALPGKGSLNSLVNNADSSVKSKEDFQKLSVEAQKEFMENNREEYQKLFA